MLVIFLVGVAVGICIGGAAVLVTTMMLFRSGKTVTRDAVTALQRDARPVYPMAADILTAEPRKVPGDPDFWGA